MTLPVINTAAAAANVIRRLSASAGDVYGGHHPGATVSARRWGCRRTIPAILSACRCSLPGLRPSCKSKPGDRWDRACYQIQGTSFNFVTPLIMGCLALKNGGADVPTMMAALFGTLMVASCTEILLSRVLHLARRIITSLVSGIVVMIIVISLIQVGLTSIGGFATLNNHTFGTPKNLMLAGVVLLNR